MAEIHSLLTGITGLLPASRGLAVATVAAALTAVLLAAAGATRAAARLRRAARPADALTVLAAAVATSVAMTGMWRFAGNVLHFTGAERISLFAFLELAMVTSAVRARGNVRDFGSAGVDGIAVWVLSALSAVLSALDARSGAEAVFRLAAPMVAAWLWERGLSLERRRVSGRQIHWRLTAERVLVWAGLAEPESRAVTDVDASRRISRLARAAKHARQAPKWRSRAAHRRLDIHLARAVEHAGLATDADRQKLLLDHLGALYGAQSLVTLNPAPPWSPDSHSDGHGDRHGDRQGRRHSDGHSDGHGDRHRRRSGDRQATVQARRLLTANPDLPAAVVMARTGVSESTVTRIKRDMRQQGDSEPVPLRRAQG